MAGNSGGFSSAMLTPFELACFLGISRWTLCDWRRSGVGPPFLKLSRRIVRYPKAQLEKWIDEHFQDQTR